MVNNEIHRLSVIRKGLEKVIDKIYENIDNCRRKEDLLEIINESNKLNKAKNEWQDRWDFNNWAKSYDEDIKKDIGKLKIYKNYEIILEKVFKIARRLGKKEGRVLEIGVGTGNLASKFLNENYEIVGIDQSREMLAVAKEKYPNLKVRLGEFLKIPYDNKEFDIIVSTYAMHHLNEKEKSIAIEEMNRVLKDNGVIVIGDLMFETKEKQKDIMSSLAKEEVEEIEDEYYSYIDSLKKNFSKYEKKMKYYKIDTFNYIVEIN